MHAHAADEITLKDIAAAAHLSRFHFLRLFRLVYGSTPVAALRELRTRRAQALMESTTLTAAEIAGRVGMSRIALWRSLRQKGAGVRQLRRAEGSARTAFLGASYLMGVYSPSNCTAHSSLSLGLDSHSCRTVPPASGVQVMR